jgi:hypothetical protein
MHGNVFEFGCIHTNKKTYIFLNNEFWISFFELKMKT